jgi:hypothetical protein
MSAKESIALLLTLLLSYLQATQSAQGMKGACSFSLERLLETFLF